MEEDINWLSRWIMMGGEHLRQRGQVPEATPTQITDLEMDQNNEGR